MRAETYEATPVLIRAGENSLAGDLVVPPAAAGMVLFAHGSRSSRHSPRNRAVAAALQERGLGTLLMDLLTPPEESVDEQTRHFRFDIPLLAGRLVQAIDWLALQDATSALRLGLFGASTGAAAALVAAAERPDAVGAVVSRGGRPDLAGGSLALVSCPTLLIVGARDEPVIGLNQEAMSSMPGAAQLAIVPGATHLFEERGALEQVAKLAGDWFTTHLRGGADRLRRTGPAR